MSLRSLELCPRRLGCEWSQHGRKHLPVQGMRREMTRRGPAKYLPGTTPEAIRALETMTVMTPDASYASPAGKAEYLRDTAAVIGWDQGEDASLSFAECSGGKAAGRAFHGRPMSVANRKAMDLHDQK